METHIMICTNDIIGNVKWYIQTKWGKQVHLLFVVYKKLKRLVRNLNPNYHKQF